jgi:hypothetical protein
MDGGSIPRLEVGGVSTTQQPVQGANRKIREARLVLPRKEIYQQLPYITMYERGRIIASCQYAVL